MSGQDWLMAAWRDMQEELDLPKCIACNVKVNTREFADAGAVLAAMEGFGPQEGWICYQSRVHVVRNGGALRGNPDEDGLPLTGELVKGSRSLLLRTVPGGWRLAEVEEGSGDSAIAFDTTRAGTGDSGVKSLAYRVYWLHDDQRGFLPRLARFTGYLEK